MTTNQSEPMPSYMSPEDMDLMRVFRKATKSIGLKAHVSKVFKAAPRIMTLPAVAEKANVSFARIVKDILSGELPIYIGVRDIDAWMYVNKIRLRATRAMDELSAMSEELGEWGDESR